MTQEDIEQKAAAIPAEERPVASSRLSGLGDFLGIYGGEHIAATEFVIGALLASWFVSAAFVVVALQFGWMHPFFLFLPTFFIAALAYLLFAWACGAGKPIPEDVRRDVDAVEARIAELAEEDAAGARTGELKTRRHLPIFGILAAVVLCALAVSAVCAPQRFKSLAVVYTALYFAFASASAISGTEAK